MKSLIRSKAYKKSKPIIQLIYSFIEVYFRHNISTKNIKLWTSSFINWLIISIDWSFVKKILKFKHLDLSVGKTLLLLLIKIKFMFSLGSSNTFSKALIEFKFNNSILSIKTNLFFLLNEDLFRLIIKSLIWFISIFFLYLAARSENIKFIKKFYKKKIILIDRFTDSTIAYQHFGMGVDIKIINTLNKYLLKNIKVNFTFLNVVNKKNLFLRLKMRKSLNRYDQFNASFYNKVQKGFLNLSKLNKKKYKVIDSNLDIKKNEELIINQVKKLIKWI